MDLLTTDLIGYFLPPFTLVCISDVSTIFLITIMSIVVAPSVLFFGHTFSLHVLVGLVIGRAWLNHSSRLSSSHFSAISACLSFYSLCLCVLVKPLGHHLGAGCFFPIKPGTVLDYPEPDLSIGLITIPGSRDLLLLGIMTTLFPSQPLFRSDFPAHSIPCWPSSTTSLLASCMHVEYPRPTTTHPSSVNTRARFNRV
jgi:hypothetical protein